MQCMQARSFVDLLVSTQEPCRATHFKNAWLCFQCSLLNADMGPLLYAQGFADRLMAQNMYPAVDAIAQGEMVSCVQCRYVPHAHHMKQTFLGLIRSDSALHVQ